MNLIVSRIKGKNKRQALHHSSNIWYKEPSKLKLKNTQENLMSDNKTKSNKLSSRPLSSCSYNKLLIFLPLNLWNKKIIETTTAPVHIIGLRGPSEKSYNTGEVSTSTLRPINY